MDTGELAGWSAGKSSRIRSANPFSQQVQQNPFSESVQSASSAESVQPTSPAESVQRIRSASKFSRIRSASKCSRIRSASKMSLDLACCVPAETIILLALHHNTVTFGFVVLNGDGNSLVVAFDGTRNYKEDYLYTDVNLILVETV